MLLLLYLFILVRLPATFSVGPCPHYSPSMHDMNREIVDWAKPETRSFTFNPDQVTYLTDSVKTSPLQTSTSGRQRLVTVIPAQATDLEDKQWLETRLEAFRALQDDVWSKTFLEGLVTSVIKPPVLPLRPEVVTCIQRSVPWHTLVTGLSAPISPA